MQRENNFQELKIFQNNNLNILFDNLQQALYQLTGESFLICGSLARIFSGEIPQGYIPKDIDVEVSKPAFRLLTGYFDRFTIPGITMVEKKPERIILYTDSKNCLEIWNATDVPAYELKKFKNKIPYKRYANNKI